MANSDGCKLMEGSTTLILEEVDCESLVGRILAKIPPRTRRFTAEGFYRGEGVSKREVGGSSAESQNNTIKQSTRVKKMLERRQDPIAHRNLLNLRMETYKVKSHCKPRRYDPSWKPLQRKLSSGGQKTPIRAAYLPTKEQRRVAEKIELLRQRQAGS